MINKRTKRSGPMPLMGRQLFRGQIAPLILANSGGVSPDVYATAYLTATAVDRTEVTPAPVPPANVEPCPFSTDEAYACENIDSNFSFCKKRSLTKSDSACTQAGNMECDYTDTLKKICTSNPRDPKYAMFCDLKKHNGKCLESFMNEEAIEKEQEEVEEGEKVKQWKATRGCQFERADLTIEERTRMTRNGISPVTTKTPCPYKEFENKTRGDIVLINRIPWRFLNWYPETP
jgi:hypothetical protein